MDAETAQAKNGATVPKNAVCPECAYSLYNLPTNVCPECGKEFDLDEVTRAANQRKP